MTRPVRIALAATLALGTLLSTAPSTPPASAGGGRVPDLAMAPLDDVQIQWVNGRRLLRFTAMMVNIGAGHFEARGSRSSTSEPMRMSQIVYETTNRSGAVAQRIPTDAVARWSGDGHDHWHVQEMMRYDLWGPGGTFRGAKVGFCFLDSDLYRGSLPGASGSSYYRGSWCGTNTGVLSNRMGISIGWGDKYGAHLAYQWVDITGMPSGTYTLRSKVDPYGFFLEQNESNNCAYATVSFNSSSSAVTVSQRDDVCVNDWSESLFAGNIRWAFETGITFGCSPDLFCTNNPVRRGEMASFLARAVSPPGPTRDYYIDDESSIHEWNINRIAEARITFGCGPDRFCPRHRVTRAEMASFLVRAFDLPATSTDYYTDDSDSIHEGNINAVSAAGIAFGCGGGRFCPRQAVTRGQMVAFLDRASRD